MEMITQHQENGSERKRGHLDIIFLLPDAKRIFSCDRKKFPKLVSLPPSSSCRLPDVLQRGHSHRAAEQQQGEDVGVQQQRASQSLQRVEGQQAKGLLAEVQTGIEIPEERRDKGTEGEERQRTCQSNRFLRKSPH